MKHGNVKNIIFRLMVLEVGESKVTVLAYAQRLMRKACCILKWTLSGGEGREPVSILLSFSSSKDSIPEMAPS